MARQAWSIDARRARWTTAIAAAIALHAILAACLVRAVPIAPVQREMVTRVAVTQSVALPPRVRVLRPVRALSPSPAPRLQPRPAPARNPATSPASHARRPDRAHAVEIARVPGTGHAGTGEYPSAGNDGETGAADGAAKQPCGYVEFSDPHGSQFDAATETYAVDVEMAVHYADGRTDSILLDYPWRYATEDADPWSEKNAGNPDFPTTFQAPPRSQRALEPPVVQYVMAHTADDGYTMLKPCASPIR